MEKKIRRPSPTPSQELKESGLAGLLVHHSRFLITLLVKQVDPIHQAVYKEEMPPEHNTRARHKSLVNLLQEQKGGEKGVVR